MEKGKSLNQVMQAIKPPQVTVLAGAPGAGKTVLALNIAERYALNEHKTVAIFSLEMSNEALIHSFLCLSAEVSVLKANEGNFSKEEWQKILSASNALHKSNLFFDDTYRTTAQDIIQKCEGLIKKHGRLDFVIVDYMQLMGTFGPQTNIQRNQERIDILNALNDFSKRLGIPILVISQLYRVDRMGKAANQITADFTVSQYSGFQGTWLLLRRETDSEEADIFCVQGENVGERIPLKFNKDFLSFFEE